MHPSGSARRISLGSGPLTLRARFGHDHWPALLVRPRRWLDRASGLTRRRPGGCAMGSLGPTHLISLLLAVTIIATTCACIASVVARRNKGRARGFFVLGFVCGLIACPILRRRRRGLNALGAVARWTEVHLLHTGKRYGTDHFAARTLKLVASNVRSGLRQPERRRPGRPVAPGQLSMIATKPHRISQRAVGQQSFSARQRGGRVPGR
jgi:hypothetical protein